MDEDGSSPEESRYRYTLVKIAQQLGDANLKSLFFLAEGKAPGLNSDCSKFPMELFRALEQLRQVTEEDQGYLQHLLIWIGRRDLAELLDGPHCNPELASSHSNTTLCSWRATLYKTFEDLSKENILTLRNLWAVPQSFAIQDGVDMSRYLLHSGRTAPGSKRRINLVADLEEIGRKDLSELVLLYQDLSGTRPRIPERDILKAIEDFGLSPQKRPASLTTVTSDKPRPNTSMTWRRPPSPTREPSPDYDKDSFEEYESEEEEEENHEEEAEVQSIDSIFDDMNEDAKGSPQLLETIQNLRDELREAKEDRLKMAERLQAIDLKLDTTIEEFEREKFEQIHGVLQKYIENANRSEEDVREVIQKEFVEKIMPEIQKLREDISDTWDTRKHDVFFRTNSSNFENGSQVMEALPTDPQGDSVQRPSSMQPSQPQIYNSDSFQNVDEASAGARPTNLQLFKIAEKPRPQTDGAVTKSTPEVPGGLISQRVRLTDESGSMISLRSNKSSFSVRTTSTVSSTYYASTKPGLTCGVPRIDKLRELRMDTERRGTRASKSVQETWHTSKYIIYPERCYVFTHFSFLHVFLRSRREFCGAIFVKELGSNMRAFVQPTNVGTCLLFGVEPCGSSTVSMATNCPSQQSMDLKVVLRGGFQEDIMLKDVIVDMGLLKSYKATKDINLKKKQEDGYFLGGDVVIQFYLNILTQGAVTPQ